MARKAEPGSLGRRLMWLAILWLGGVGAVSVISFGLRLWLAPK